MQSVGLVIPELFMTQTQAARQSWPTFNRLTASQGGKVPERERDKRKGVRENADEIRGGQQLSIFSQILL